MHDGAFPSATHREDFLLGEEEAAGRPNLHLEQKQSAGEHILEKQDYVLCITSLLGEEEFVLARLYWTILNIWK